MSPFVCTGLDILVLKIKKHQGLDFQTYLWSPMKKVRLELKYGWNWSSPLETNAWDGTLKPAGEERLWWKRSLWEMCPLRHVFGYQRWNLHGKWRQARCVFSLMLTSGYSLSFTAGHISIIDWTTPFISCFLKLLQKWGDVTRRNSSCLRCRVTLSSATH